MSNLFVNVCQFSALSFVMSVLVECLYYVNFVKFKSYLMSVWSSVYYVQFKFVFHHFSFIKWCHAVPSYVFKASHVISHKSSQKSIVLCCVMCLELVFSLLSCPIVIKNIGLNLKLILSRILQIFSRAIIIVINRFYNHYT